MKSLWGNHKGNVALEFVLMFPLFLVMTLGSIDAGLWMMMDATLERAASAAARYGLTVPAPSGETTQQAIQSLVWSDIGIWLPEQSDLTISEYVYPSYADLNLSNPCPGPTCPATAGTGGYGSIVRYTIQITRPTFTGILGIVGINSYTLSRTLVVINESDSVQ